VLDAAEGRADPGPTSRELPRGVVVAAEDVPLGGRAPASAPLVVIDMGPCPADPARATAEAVAFAEAARTAGWPTGPAVAVRTGFTDASEAVLARLRVLRAAGLCDLADLAAPFGGAAEPDMVLDALEAADTVRTALRVPVMLSGFWARPDQVATHILAGRIDAWCVPGPQ
jgi:hypothetical protein